MAEIIPNIHSTRFRCAGERRFAQRLASFLEDDYLVWYDIPVGRQRRCPDFIVLHPARGLLFLEVKDWKLATIQGITPERVTLELNHGRKIVSNPLEQARQYAYTVINLLERDPQLVCNDGRYTGKLCFPYGYGVVYTNISRTQWDAQLSEFEQERLLPAHRLLCQNEMSEKTEAENFQSRLWGMFEYRFGEQLTLPQIDRIRWHLFPEVRIATQQTDLFSPETDTLEKPDHEKQTSTEDALPDIVRVMDIQQEQLAKSMGEGHRVIHGVAGSGKTLILGYRCLHLSRTSVKPILVLCFNITLAAYLREFIAAKGIIDKVQIYHFHDWCKQQLKTYHVDSVEADTPWETQVASVVAGVEKGLIPRAQYDAVMIDEGHDFERDWLALVVQMIDPNANSLLLLYDDAQSIYGAKRLPFSLSSAGIQARGRTTILRFNYRNTREILSFAYAFAEDYLQAKDGDDEHVPLIAPEVAGTSGPVPEVRVFSSIQEEADFIARCVGKWQDKGRALGEIAIVYAHHWQAEHIYDHLQYARIPCHWLKTNTEKRHYRPNNNAVTLLTRQSSKGLEFHTVILCGIGALKNDRDSVSRETRLLYIGMTRARQQLLVTGSGESWALERLLGQAG